MISEKLIYAIDNLMTIYLNNMGRLELRKGVYIGGLKLKSSLVQLLPLFELPTDVILNGIKDEDMKIEDILPFDDIVIFLLIEMKSTYWYRLVCSFLLCDQLSLALSDIVIESLENKQLISWLPQREEHLTMRVLVKMKRYRRS